MTENKDNGKNTTVFKDIKKDNKNKTEKPLAGKNCITKKILQLSAWVLFLIGICLVSTAFYFAIYFNINCIEQVLDGNDDDIATDHAAVDLQAKPSDGVQHHNSEIKKTFKNITGRFSSLHDMFGKKLNVCQEHLCQIACTKVHNIYRSLDETLKASSCLSIDQLVLEGQEFRSGVLKNLWLPSNITIHEIIIRSSNISKIKSNAFNSFLFKNTIALTLSHTNISKVQSGAFLGLYSLKYLSIKANIYRYESAIFQPVQTSLANLKLNANIRLRGNQNPFDKNFFSKLMCLDLSKNRFVGSLGKNLFKSTPNLKYLTIAESEIESVEEDAFEDLLGKLTFLSLAKNKLTTLDADILRPVLMVAKISFLNLANNDWICNCDLLEFSSLYQKYRQHFMDILYCKGPHNLYGLSLDEVDYGEQNCVLALTTDQDTVEIVEVDINTTEISSNSGAPNIKNTSDYLQSSEKTSTEAHNMLKMRCFNMDNTDEINAAPHSLDHQPLNEDIVNVLKKDSDYMQFPAPIFDFDLQLIAENNSVIVTIENPTDLLVIWFNESPLINYSDTSCMRYALPELVVGPLEENTTYTFCLLSTLANDVMPFDCLPLHVPAKRLENIWISEDNKGFTIAMLCLIFLLSTIAGGLIAYCSIKTFPDLLEGSKSVLLVKKPDHADYVATISETEYQKLSSVKKAKLNAQNRTFKKQSSIKLSLPHTQTCGISPTPFPMSVKELERLASLKSSSTCFEDTFPSYTLAPADDEYETPMVCNSCEYKFEKRCVENLYGMSPKSPPPLPKRNSKICNSPMMALNGFSSKVE